MTVNKIKALSATSKVLFFLVLACFLTVLFIRVRLITVYAHNIGGMEQNVVYSIQTLASGSPLYSDPEKPLYSVTQYSPIYFYLVSASGKCLGFDPGEPILWYRLSRLFSLLFNLLLLLVVYKVLRLINPAFPILAIGLSLLLFIFFEQQDYSRPDSLYHLMFGLTLYFYIQVWYKMHPLRNLILTGAALAVALYSKQSAVFLLVLILFSISISQETLKKIHWFLLSFITSVVILKYLFLAVSGEILLKNLYWGLMNGFDLIWAVRMYYLPSLPRFILFFSGMSLLLLYWNKNKIPLGRFITLSALYYFIIALISGMKWGSGTNYFFEFCLLIILGFMLLYDILQKENIHNELLQKISLALVISMLIPQLMIITWRDYYKSDPTSYYNAKETIYRVEKQNWYNSQTRFIIPERKWLSNFLYNKTLYAQPDIFRTLWNIDPAISVYHPIALPSENNLCLIKNSQNNAQVFFNTSCQGFVPIFASNGYQIFCSPIKP